MNKISFRAQFETIPANFEEKLFNSLILENKFFDYPVYRCLDRLVLLDIDGKYYLSRRG